MRKMSGNNVNAFGLHRRLPYVGAATRTIGLDELEALNTLFS